MRRRGAHTTGSNLILRGKVRQRAREELRTQTAHLLQKTYDVCTADVTGQFLPALYFTPVMSGTDVTQEWTFGLNSVELTGHCTRLDLLYHTMACISNALYYLAAAKPAYVCMQLMGAAPRMGPLPPSRMASVSRRIAMPACSTRALVLGLGP